MFLIIMWRLVYWRRKKNEEKWAFFITMNNMHTYVPLWFLHWHTVWFWGSWQLEGEEEEEKDEKGGRRGGG